MTHGTRSEQTRTAGTGLSRTARKDWKAAAIASMTRLQTSCSGIARRNEQEERAIAQIIHGKRGAVLILLGKGLPWGMNSAMRART